MVLNEEEKSLVLTAVKYGADWIVTPSFRRTAQACVDEVENGPTSNKSHEDVDFVLTLLYEGRENYAPSRLERVYNGTHYEVQEKNPHRLMIESILPLRDKIRKAKSL